MDLKCKDCNHSVSIRVKAGYWITLKCDCKMIIIYFDGVIKIKTKEEYLEWKRNLNIK